MPQVSFSELTELTGSLGIGSITVLACMMVLDAVSPIYSLIEANAESNTWAIFVALPLLVISYVAGVISGAIGNTVRHRLFFASRKPVPWKEVPENLMSLAVVEYRNVQRRIDVLDGSITAFLALAVGVVFEAVHFWVPLLGFGLCLLCLFASLMCTLIAVRTENEFLGFIDRIRSRK